MSRKDNGKARKRGKDAEKEQYSSSWCDLPPLFTSSLLYYLSPKTRCAFKATCRSWNDATLLLPVPVGSPSSPCHSAPALIRTKLETTSHECYYPMTGERFRLSTGEKRYRDAVVHCSNSDWLLMSEYLLGDSEYLPKRFFFYFNPFTKHVINHGVCVFPRDDLFPAVCFKSPPTNSSRFQVFSRYLERFLMLITNDTGTFLISLPEVLRKQHKSPRNSLVVHRGLYYCLVGAGVVGVSDGASSSYTFHDTGLFEPGTKLRHSFLIEVDGKLLGIFDYQGMIWVLWLDTGKWDWDPVGDEDLRDKILYVSYKGSFVQCDDTTKGVGNKIYFPMIIDGGGVYYSLDTKKFHTQSRKLDEIEDCGDSMTWIAPTTS